jgi:hypothetical protein
MEPGKGTAYGWAIRWNDQGWCTVGTAGSGPFKRFSFELTRYDAPSDPAACVFAQLLERDKRPGPSANEENRSAYRAAANGAAAAVAPHHIELSSLGSPLMVHGDKRRHMETAHFMHSPHSVRDDWQSVQLGSRHSAMRDVSYPEAVQKLEEMGLQSEAWLHAVHSATPHRIAPHHTPPHPTIASLHTLQVRRIVTQMDIIVDDMPPEHAAAACALQEALLEMLSETDGDGDGEAEEPCEPCEPEPEPTEQEHCPPTHPCTHSPTLEHTRLPACPPAQVP